MADVPSLAETVEADDDNESELEDSADSDIDAEGDGEDLEMDGDALVTLGQESLMETGDDFVGDGDDGASAVQELRASGEDTVEGSGDHTLEAKEKHVELGAPPVIHTTNRGDDNAPIEPVVHVEPVIPAPVPIIPAPVTVISAPAPVEATSSAQSHGRPVRESRKRMADVLTALSECTCGKSVTKDEREAMTSVVRCRVSGCETEWVSHSIS